MLDHYRAESAVQPQPRPRVVPPGGAGRRAKRHEASPNRRTHTDRVEGSDFFRGLLVALPAGVALWVLLFWVAARLFF